MKKIRFSQLLLFIISCFLFSSTIEKVQAALPFQTPELRLVEVGDSKAQWLHTSELQKLSAQTHSMGFCASFVDFTDNQWLLRTPLPKPFFQIKRSISQKVLVKKILAGVSAGNILNTVTKLSSFGTRHFEQPEGELASLWIKKQFETLSAGKSYISVSEYSHQFRQPTIIATIKGEGELASEIIVLGGHADSINHRGRFLGHDKVKAPGADDNASGIASLLEVFRVIAASDVRPKRTIQFMAYAAEEAGLKGSLDVAANYFKQKKNVFAVLQFDMTMYAGSGNQLSFITTHTENNLTAFATKLVDEYVGVPWFYSVLPGRASSDHYSWYKVGYPAIYPFEAEGSKYNKNIHSDSDTVRDGALDSSFGLNFTKLGVAFALELALSK